MKKIALLYILLLPLTAFSQKLRVCNDADELHSAIDSIIKKEFYKDSIGDSVKIYFHIKIDSVGEIHSCHILRTPNLNIDEQYFNRICLSIENEIRVPFLYLKEDMGCYLRKYNCWNIPFVKPKRDNEQFYFPVKSQ